MNPVTTSEFQGEQTINTPILSVDETESVEDRLTDNALHGILPARYFLKNKDGDILENATEMFRRVAENVAGAEATEADQEYWEEEFQYQMETLQLMPNSPTLMNAGTDMNQLSACFVLEPQDDMEHIFEMAKNAALIFQSGGGVGYSFSELRERGAYINSTGGEASGPVSFMRVFDETCNQVKQGGKRRGAQMAILRVDHPDIGRFAVAKREEGELDNFNISVGYTDEFIEALENGEDYTLYSPTDYENPCEVREATSQFYDPTYQDNPTDAYDDGEGAVVKENLWRDYADTIVTTDGQPLRDKWEDEIELSVGEEMSLPAEFLWDIMVDGAWRNGEPGLFYLDETNREHSFDVDEHPKHIIKATNPCAEQPLSNFEACNLAHINLSLMLREDAVVFDEFDGDIEHYFHDVVDFTDLYRTIESGVRFLDNVITQSNFPIEEIEERVSGQRKIGLGIMGFAQMLYQMGIPYGSDESYEIARYIMRFIDREATIESHILANNRGSFDYWNESKYSDPESYPEWFESHTGLPAEDYPNGFAIRNHNVTTIAPTGTTSMIANTSGGCEPVFNVANFKNVGNDIQGDDVLVEFDEYFLKTLAENDIPVERVKEEAETLMRDNEFDGVDDLSIPEELKEIFVTTEDLTSRQHGLMQRAFQEFCDSGISKTINMPNDARRTDVEDAYKLAFKDSELGAPIKGLTVYRDGSREEQVLTTRMDNSLEEDTEEHGKVPCPETDCDGMLEDTEDCAVCPECFASPCN